MARTAPRAADSGAVVGRLAVQLARAGEAGLGPALAGLVRDAGLRTAVLRRVPDGALLAVAGDVVRVVPPPRGASAPDLELPVGAPGGPQLAVLAVSGARPALLPVLRDAAAVLGLALAAEAAPADQASLLQHLEDDRTLLADALHDGPMQDLVAARFTADLATRTGDATAVREAVQEALVALRRRVWQLRPRGHDGLAAALDALSASLVESGGAALVLDLDAGADVLGPVPARVAYRVVQAVATGTASAPSLTVRLRREAAPGGRENVALTVEGASSLADATRWRRAAQELGGDLACAGSCVRLVLPLLSCPGLPARDRTPSVTTSVKAVP